MVFLEPIWRFFSWEHWLLLLFPALPGPNCPVTTGRALPRSPFVRDCLNLKALFLKQQETEVKFEAINVSDRSSVVTSREFGGCLSVLLPLPAWGSRKDSQPDVFQEALSGSSLEFPIPGPKKRHFPGLRWLAIFPAKPSADPGHLEPDQQLVPTAGLSQC